MNSIVLRGERADVKHVYHHAAQLGPWRIDGHAFSAEIRTSNPLHLSRQPLTLVVPVKGGTWRYTLTDVSVTGVSLKATATVEG